MYVSDKIIYYMLAYLIKKAFNFTMPCAKIPPLYNIFSWGLQATAAPQGLWGFQKKRGLFRQPLWLFCHSDHIIQS